MPEDTRYLLYDPDRNNVILPTLVLLATTTMRHSQNWTVDFKKVLTRGVKGIREEAQAKLAALTEFRDLATRKPYRRNLRMGPRKPGHPSPAAAAGSAPSGQTV